MQIEELPSPTFILNENGNVTVFIPEMQGEPEGPRISGVGKNTLFFNRSAGEGCRLTYITDEVMAALGRVDKCLVIELDLDKVVDLYEQDSAGLEAAFKKVYEAEVAGILEREKK